jgi:hypothetical protein
MLFPDLQTFIRSGMGMPRIYQPVTLMALIERDGRPSGTLRVRSSQGELPLRWGWGA